MTIYKNKGIIYANTILELLQNADIKEHVVVDTFNNCREQGYKIKLRNPEDYDYFITIWIYAHRNSDRPTITWTPKANYSEVYDEESWTQRTESFNSCEEAVNRIEKLINEVK